MYRFIEAIGWYGVVAIIGAYLMISFSVLSVNNLWYQVLNATGAMGMVFEAFHKRDWQPGVVNVVWTLIAVVAIGRIVWA
jgi:hypothetical protein